MRAHRNNVIELTTSYLLFPNRVHSGSNKHLEIEGSKSSSDAYPKLIQDGEALKRALTDECKRIKAEEPVSAIRVDTRDSTN